MKINLTYIMRTLFKDRSEFRKISNEEKGKWGFIVNRMLSKRYPEFAQKLNVRSGDFAMVLNLWWVYLGTRRDLGYNSWIWISGSKKSKVDNQTLGLIRRRYPFLEISDIEHLQEYHSDIFKEEVKYYKKLKEEFG